MSIQPYMFFNGRSEEAIAFYGEALGAKLIMQMTFDANPQPQAMPLPQGWGSKIMHCALQIDDATLLASDAMSNESTRFDGFMVSLNAADAAQAEQRFNALYAGGRVRMPLGKTFWSPCFGMLTDRFGVGWMIGKNDPAQAGAAQADESR